MTAVKLYIRSIPVLFLFLAVCCSVNILQAADVNLHKGPDLTYPFKLYQQQDYYRAVTEILRLKFLFPKDSARHRLDQYLVKSYYELRLYGHAERAANHFLQHSDPSDHEARTNVAMLLVFSQLQQDKYPDARQTWLNYISQDLVNLPPSVKNIPDRIDPEKARLFSSIIPGSGLILSHQYGSAIVSFLINAAFIAGTYHYFNNHQYGVAGLLLFFEIGWYSGGKKAAYEAAENYNHNQLELLRQNWIESQQLTF